MITGELSDDAHAIRVRTVELVAELGAEGAAHLDEAECATTAQRARALPEVAALWPSLRAEVPLFAMDADGTLVAGRADAVSVVDGRIDVVLDWKSDLNPHPEERATYARQVAGYLRFAGAQKGAIVYLSRGEVVWVR